MATTAAMASVSSPAAGSGDKAKPDIAAILKKSGMRALGGGLSGAAAMGINVGALMWLRTVRACALLGVLKLDVCRSITGCVCGQMKMMKPKRDTNLTTRRRLLLSFDTIQIRADDQLPVPQRHDHEGGAQDAL